VSVDRLIKLHEGFSRKPYRCPAGRITIGYGRNLEANGISAAEAEVLLRNDINRCAEELKQKLPWVSELDPVRQAVLLDMCYNLGITGLCGFTATLLAIREGDYETAAVRMLDSKWATQVKTRATRLAAMMRTGQWPDVVMTKARGRAA
jgi:lysozyme